MGLTELESVTSCVSSRRSNQLSYKPLSKILNSRPGVQLESTGSKTGDQLESKLPHLESRLATVTLLNLPLSL